MNQLDYRIIENQIPVTTLGEHIKGAMDVASRIDEDRYNRFRRRKEMEQYDKSLSDEQKLTKIFDSGFNPETGRVDLQKVAPELFKAFKPEVAYNHLQAAMKHHDELDQQERADEAQRGIEQQKIDQQIFNENRQIYGETGDNKTVSPELAADNTRLANIASMTPMEQAQYYGLVEGSAYNPGAKAIVDYTIPKIGINKKTDFDKKMEEMKKISEMPDGQEKNKAFENFMYSTSAGQYYKTSPEGIQAEIAKTTALAGPEAAAAGRKAYSQEAGKQATIGGQQELAIQSQKVKDAEINLEAANRAKETAKQNRMATIDLIDELINTPENSMPVGLTLAQIGKIIPGSNQALFMLKNDQLVSSVVAASRKGLRAPGEGATTESEGALYKKAATVLNSNWMNPKQYKQELIRLRNQILSIDNAGNSGGTKGQNVDLNKFWR